MPELQTIGREFNITNHSNLTDVVLTSFESVYKINWTGNPKLCQSIADDFVGRVSPEIVITHTNDDGC